MFNVMARNDHAVIRTVFAVDKKDGGTIFLIWFADGWLWVNADGYIPVTRMDGVV